MFDEIEKASDALWQLLLGILDKGVLTLGDNRKVDFSRTIVVMTSNLGVREMGRLVTSPIGFAPQPKSHENLDRAMHKVALDAARGRFSAEFMNRIDKVVVFRSLGSEELAEVLRLELVKVQERVIASQPEKPFTFRCTSAARAFLLREGISLEYGARHLKRAIERHLVFPLCGFIASGQIGLGDMLVVDVNSDSTELIFGKQEVLKSFQSGA